MSKNYELVVRGRTDVHTFPVRFGSEREYEDAQRVLQEADPDGPFVVVDDDDRPDRSPEGWRALPTCGPEGSGGDLTTPGIYFRPQGAEEVVACEYVHDECAYPEDQHWPIRVWV